MVDIIDRKEYKKVQQKEMELHERDTTHEDWESLGSEYENIGAHYDASRCWNRASLMRES